MIPVETWYKTHNQELLAIIEALKTWRHYLVGCKYEVFILTDHNNLCQWIDTKSLSSCQICWVQELFQYHFQINYCQGKANAIADALSHFPQRSQVKEKTLWDGNTQILYYLRTLLTKASLVGLSLLGHETVNFLPLYQVLICETHVLPRLCQFWTELQGKLAHKEPYQ